MFPSAPFVVPPPQMQVFVTNAGTTRPISQLFVRGDLSRLSATGNPTIEIRKKHRIGRDICPLAPLLLGSLEWEFDLMIPVPLSKQRFQERGYNQSKYMAIPLHLALDIPISDRALVRTQHTTSQVGLTGQERRENVCHAFTAHSEEVEEKNILVIDDVTTTGATMRACSTALMEAEHERCANHLARAGLAAHPESLLG